MNECTKNKHITQSTNQKGSLNCHWQQNWIREKVWHCGCYDKAHLNHIFDLLPNFVDIHIDKIDETSTEGLFPDTFYDYWNNISAYNVDEKWYNKIYDVELNFPSLTLRKIELLPTRNKVQTQTIPKTT